VDPPETLLQSRAGPDAPEEQARRSPFAARRARGPGGAPRPQAEDPELVLGRYRLLARLGAGGFGVVWRAHDELLRREVAVKRIWLGPDGDAERAAREAQATARLSHPAIVALYEACPQGEAFYLISELVHGETLGRLIAADELDDERIIEIGLDLLDALEHAHARGVIHRDIKPQNVLIPDVPLGRATGDRPIAAKLTDFGGASIAEEDALTRTGDVLGTLAYMAPEQSEGREVGAAADLYALALVLYEALAGVNPVRGATPAATARRIGSRLEPLGRRRRDLPRSLTSALDAALSPAPRDRGSLAELRGELTRALEDPSPRPRRRRIAAFETPTAAAGEPLHAPPPHAEEDLAPAEEDLAPAPREILAGHGLPRTIWIALALGGVAWLAATGRPGVALLAVAALLPVAAMPAERHSRRLSPVWLGCLLAPALGVAGLAGAWPSVAGQARRWRKRLLLGALGYWWTALAEPLLGRRLWLGAPGSTPPRSVWEGSLGATAPHVLIPLLSTGMLLGALLWGVGAVLLPWIVRGASAAVDVVAATVWSAALVSLAPPFDAGLTAGAHPSARGAVLGAVLGGMVAVGARALRGPV
jgi:eukaryotic-like serine/threonine-protein kinase